MLVVHQVYSITISNVISNQILQLHVALLLSDFVSNLRLFIDTIDDFVDVRYNVFWMITGYIFFATTLFDFCVAVLNNMTLSSWIPTTLPKLQPEILEDHRRHLLEKREEIDENLKQLEKKLEGCL